MNPELTREIAVQVVNATILSNWKFYGILLILIFISSSVGIYLVSYFKKRGENYATKSDFDSLMQQLKASTEATESIKIALEHSNWASKEWKTLRRIKLEELLGSIYITRNWINHEQLFHLYGDTKPEISDPPINIEFITTLYFPELQPYVSSFMLKIARLRSDIYGFKVELIAKRAQINDSDPLFAAYIDKWKKDIPILFQSIKDIEQQSTIILNNITSA